MNPRLIAQLIAGGRVVIGLALVAKPALVTSRWVGDDEADRPGARVLGTGLGGRDVVVGAGTLAALSAGDGSVRPWLIGSVLADTVDLIGTLRSAGELPGERRRRHGRRRRRRGRGRRLAAATQDARR